MGKGGGGTVTSSAGEQAERLAAVQANLAQKLFAQSDPLRRDVLTGMRRALPRAQRPVNIWEVGTSPLYPVVKQGTEQTFDLARDRVLESLPAGGVLQEGLADLEGQRAAALSQGVGAIAENLTRTRQADLDRAISLASGGTAQGLSGLSSASSIFSGLQAQNLAAAQAQAQRDAQKAGGAGQLVGTLGSALILK